jgi:short-subunit dehydrogenase
MRPPIDGASVLITGASAGIGTELARQLAGRVQVLILVARRIDRLEKLASDLRAAHPKLTVHVFSCDLADHGALGRFVDEVTLKVNPIDVLINNAGLGDFTMFDMQPWDHVERMIDVNIRALAYLTRRLLPGMVARGRGGILNIGSMFGLQFLAGYSAYIGTKHYVNGFTEALRLELAPAGIAVTQVCPGPVKTEFEDIAGEYDGYGVGMQKLMEISAAQCARESLAGFERGRARVKPGGWLKLLTFFSDLAPIWLYRLFVRGPAKRTRAVITERMKRAALELQAPKG